MHEWVPRNIRKKTQHLFFPTVAPPSVIANNEHFDNVQYILWYLNRDPYR